MSIDITTLSLNDLDSLCLVAWKEARGDGDDAMRAVMHVIINRVLSAGFPKTLHDVIYQRNAFSSMTVPSDPEYNLQPHAGDPQYAYCETISNGVVTDSDVDLTCGAVYYANEKYITSGWYKKVIIDSGQHPVTVIIGKQTFRK